MVRVFLLCGYFEEGKGSYTGVFEKFARYLHKHGHKVYILTGLYNKKLLDMNVVEEIDPLPYAKVHRFPIPTKKLPLLGQNHDYIAIAKGIKKTLAEYKVNDKDIIIANCLAGLGGEGYNYYLRMGQPAYTVISNMEIKKGQSLMSRIGRFAHLFIQSVLELKVVKHAQGYILPSEETKKNILKHYGYTMKGKPIFIPFSGVEQ